MTRLGRLLALIAALGGFAAAHAVTQSGQAMQLPPITSVTTVLPTLPLPPPPTTALPPPPTTVPLPPPPTTTVPLPVPVPPLPPPPTPTVTTPIVPAPVLPPQTGTLPRIPPPAPAPAATSPAPASAPSSSSPAPTGSAAAGGGTAGDSTTSSATRPQRLRATERRTARRVSVRLEFTLPQAGRIFLVVRGPAPSCRLAGVIPVRGRQGTNTVYFAGRVHGRRLEPGLYLISLSPTRRVDPGAPAELVRVESWTRSVPAPDSAPRPDCSTAQVPGEATAENLVREAPRSATPPTVRPAAPLRPPAQAGDADGDEDDSAGFLPIPAALDPDTGTEAIALIAIVTLVGALLLGMIALVTRFVRGSWNP